MPAESLAVLEKADVPPRQAQAFVHAIEIEMIGALSTLATKQDLQTQIGSVSSDLKVLRADLDAKIGIVHTGLEAKIGSVSGDLKVLRADLDAKIGTVHTDLEAKIGSVSSDLKVLRADLDAKIGTVHTDLETKIGEVGSEVKVLRADLRTTREELRKEMQSMRADLVAQMHASMNRSTWQLCGLTVTLMGMMLGVVYFLVGHNVH